MKSNLFTLSLLTLVFASCNSVYKSGQTPDDVYYSPARTEGTVEVRERRDERREPIMTYSDWLMDRDIRMRMRDPRWRRMDWDMGFTPYHFGGWNGYYYNPFYYPLPVFSPGVVTPVNPKVNTPRTTNLNAYVPPVRNFNQTNTPRNIKTGAVGSSPVRQYNNRNQSSSGLGTTLRRVLDPAGSNNRNSGSSGNDWNSGRSYNSGSSSSGSSSGSSGGGGVSRPARSGRN